MGFLRGVGYFFAILMLLAGLVLFPIGLILIIPAIIMMYVLHKGGQVKAMRNSLKKIEQAEAERLRLQTEERQRKFDAGWGQEI